MIHIILNSVITFIWMAFIGNISILTTLYGWLIGMGLFILLQPIFPKSQYRQKCWASLKFGIHLLQLWFLSTLYVIKSSCQPTLLLNSDIIMIDTHSLSKPAQSLLGIIMTLIPGIILLKRAKSILYGHALYPNSIQKKIQKLIPNLEIISPCP